MSAKKKHGFLLVLANPSPVHEDEFNTWYDAEHLPERMAVPGFLGGLRYVVTEGYPKYLAHYDLQDPSILDSPAYKAVSGENFSSWTRRVTATSRVDRIAGYQIWPGDAVLPRAPRLRLLRFGLAKEEEQALVSAVEAFAADPATGTRSAIVLRSEDGSRHYVLIASTFCPPDHELLPRFGSLAERIEQSNLYVAYLPV